MRPRPPQPSAVRFRVEPGDLPPEKVARRLHLTLAEFTDKLPRLYDRGFPRPDPDTGNYDLDAIERWRKLRPGVKHLYPELTVEPLPIQAEPQQRDMGDRFVEAQKRKRHG